MRFHGEPMAEIGWYYRHHVIWTNSLEFVDHQLEIRWDFTVNPWLKLVDATANIIWINSLEFCNQMRFHGEPMAAIGWYCWYYRQRNLEDCTVNPWRKLVDTTGTTSSGPTLSSSLTEMRFHGEPMAKIVWYIRQDPSSLTFSPQSDEISWWTHG